MSIMGTWQCSQILFCFIHVSVYIFIYFYFEIDDHLTLSAYSMADNLDLRRCLGAMGRIAAHIPLVALLTEIARTLMVGKLRVGTRLSRTVRLELDDAIRSNNHEVQIVLNEVARW